MHKTFVTDSELDEGNEMNLWLMLASISDVRNLGAILRSAYYLGARYGY